MKPLNLNLQTLHSLREKEDDLLKWFSKATPSERFLVMEYHGKLFTGKTENVIMTDDDRKTFFHEKKENIVKFSFSILLYAIFICQSTSIKKLCSNKDEANNILAEIEEERTIRFLNKNRHTKFIDKLRKHYLKIKELREKHNASWSEICRLLKRNNAQYYKGYKITPSYLRRTFNKIDDEEKKIPDIFIATEKEEAGA